MRRKDIIMKKNVIIILSSAILLITLAFSVHAIASDRYVEEIYEYGPIGTPYYASFNNGYYYESEDAYWRAPRVPVRASDGSIRYVSRTYMVNSRYPSRYRPAVGGYGRVYRRTGQRGVITRILDFLI
jgi:hypothetical protein